MEDPIKMVRQDDTSLEEITAALTNEIRLADRLPNISERGRHLEDVLEAADSAHSLHPKNSTISKVQKDTRDLLFDLRNTESQIRSVEERLGQDESEPVDLTLQHTLDVVQQLRRLSVSIPNDDRLAMVATNVCEGLESFVTAVLSESQPGGDGDGQVVGASPGDLTLALEVIGAIQVCPGSDRTSTYKILLQQFIDAACHSAWSRLDRLFDTRLDRAVRKEYLHEALTIWTLLPDLTENAGSPRLSQLPEEIQRTIEQVLMREVVGSVDTEDAQDLLDASLLASELGEEYIAMIPAISVPDAQTTLGLKSRDTLIRRTKRALSEAKSWRDLETCLSVISVLKTIPGVADDERVHKLSWQVRLTSLRLRGAGALGMLRRLSIPAVVALTAIMGLTAGYIGLAVLVQRVYDYNIPFAP